MSDDIRTRFVNEIKLRAFDDQYVDRKEEKEILQIAISLNVDIDTARMALVQACRMENYALESEIISEMKAQLHGAAGDDGKVDESEFNMIVNTMNAKINGRGDIKIKDIKRMILEEMDKSGFDVKTGFFSNWYKAARKEVGLA